VTDDCSYSAIATFRTLPLNVKWKGMAPISATRITQNKRFATRLQGYATVPNNYSQWRCYIIGFNQRWSDANMDLCRQLIEESDFCADAPEGIPIGTHFTTHTIYNGKGKVIPKDLVCIGHQYNGKIAIVRAFQGRG
jgi:hypothetical protein